MKKIPIVALCGFLGSGKTTLLRRWRREEALQDAAVLVHDLSEFGLDVELLSGDDAPPAQGHLQGRVAALHGVHARDQLQSSVANALEGIAQLDPPAPLVLCESTGAAKPWPLIEALTQDDRFSLRHFLVTVDALNLHRDFADGEGLTGKPDSFQDPALRHAAEVLAEQLAFASMIVLTKIDMLSDSVVNTQVRWLQKLQPHAAIGLSAHAGLLLPQLEGVPSPNTAEMKGRAQNLGLMPLTATADEIESLILRDPRPFHPERLHQACQQYLGTGLYRTKGFLWLASRPDQVLLWQQSGSQISLEMTGFWRAEIARNRDGTLTDEEVEILQQQLHRQHPLFGDRHNELTLIGLKADRDRFYAALEDALCTDEEVLAWRNGETFSDPWPTSIRRVV